MNKIHNRKKFKLQLGDRKSVAAQNRMKNIATLASDTIKTSAATSGKRRRGNDVVVTSKKGGKDDDFGRNDDDWKVYRQIVRLFLASSLHEFGLMG